MVEDSTGSDGPDSWVSSTFSSFTAAFRAILALAILLPNFPLPYSSPFLLFLLSFLTLILTIKIGALLTFTILLGRSICLIINTSNPPFSEVKSRSPFPTFKLHFERPVTRPFDAPKEVYLNHKKDYISGPLILRI